MTEKELRTWSGELIGYVDDTQFDPDWPAVCFPVSFHTPQIIARDADATRIEPCRIGEMRRSLWRYGADDPYECWRLSEDDVPFEALRRMRWFREIPATVEQKGQVT